MSATLTIGIALLGGLGAVARYLTHLAVEARTGQAFPYGTMVVNLSGALALGLLVGAFAASSDTGRLLGTGFLGGYTTFSTWMLESQRLGAAGRGRAAALNIALSLTIGVLAVWLGRSLSG